MLTYIVSQKKIKIIVKPTFKVIWDQNLHIVYKEKNCQ